MTALLEGANRRIDQRCLVKGGLTKDGCKIGMTDAPACRLVVDFDKPGSPLPENAPRCDYLLVAEGEDDHVWVAVLELKRGRLHAGQVVRQLRAGASVAKTLVHRGEAFRFRPIAAFKGASKHEIRKLRDKSNMINLHGHREPVRLMKCGGKLVEVFDL